MKGWGVRDGARGGIARRGVSIAGRPPAGPDDSRSRAGIAGYGPAGPRLAGRLAGGPGGLAIPILAPGAHHMRPGRVHARGRRMGNLGGSPGGPGGLCPGNDRWLMGDRRKWDGPCRRFSPIFDPSAHQPSHINHFRGKDISRGRPGPRDRQASRFTSSAWRDTWPARPPATSRSRRSRGRPSCRRRPS